MYKETTWMEAKRLRAQGMSYQEIGQILGIDRRTAKKLTEDKEPPEPARRDRATLADDYEELIRAWLEDRPRMRATFIYERLKPLGYDGSYSVVKRKVAEIRDELDRVATVRFETLPGYQAQVDFGEARVLFISGIVKATLLVTMYGFSRWRRTVLCPNQTRASLTAGLGDCFSEAGGVPAELLFDNLKPVVIKPRRSGEEAQIAPEWLRFCAHYGTGTRACWPYRPQTKGKVERPIGVVKSFLANHTFLDLAHLEGELARADAAYNARVHSTTNMTPEARLAIERSYLIELPAEPFAYSLTYDRQVWRDCFLHFDGNQYSAPAPYAGTEIKVRATPSEIHIVSAQGALLAAHARRPKGSGARVLNPEHWTGLAGAPEAISSLVKLQDMGLSPYIVEKRDLAVYEEVAHGDS